MTTRARPSGRVIRAAELAQYGYCARAWWLGAVAGVASANTSDLSRGIATHTRHGRAVIATRLARIAAAALIALAVVLILAGILLR